MPPKVKLSMWKTATNSLPTLSNITKRGIITNPLCLFCRKSVEDASHMFWGCKIFRRVLLSLFPSLYSFLSGFKSYRSLMDRWKGTTEALKGLNQ